MNLIDIIYFTHKTQIMGLASIFYRISGVLLDIRYPAKKADLTHT